MKNDPVFLINICDDFFYKSKSGKISNLERREARSHRWIKNKLYISNEWKRRFTCDCGSVMTVLMGRIEYDEPDMQIIIQKVRLCLSKDELKIKDIIE